jgi:caa(3)-type oxidase subunit IV
VSEEKEHHTNYVKIWGILVVLLVVSVLGPMLEIRIITLIAAFGIALVKAYLVAKYFMHLDVEKPIVHFFLATALIFMVLLFAGVAPDVMNHEGRNWVNDSAENTYQSTDAGHGEHAEPAGDTGGH